MLTNENDTILTYMSQTSGLAHVGKIENYYPLNKIYTYRVKEGAGMRVCVCVIDQYSSCTWGERWWRVFGC